MANIMAHVSGDVAIFTEHRDLLLGVAHRMLGSMADAEDVVQPQGCAGPLWTNQA
jgi:DNA-directed RNA polymerase specialized sigma24 family protein